MLVLEFGDTTTSQLRLLTVRSRLTRYRFLYGARKDFPTQKDPSCMLAILLFTWEADALIWM